MCKMNILKALGIPVMSFNVSTYLIVSSPESATCKSRVCVVSTQLSADCSNEIPSDYEMSVGGPPTNPISGASDITVNESFAGLDLADQVLDLQQLYPDAEIAPRAGESYVIDGSKYLRFYLL